MLSEEEKKAIKNLENLSEFGLSATLNQTDLDKMDIILKLIKKQQEQLELIKEYAHQEIVNYTETIRDYIDDDKEKNKDYIGELKEDREHWKDIEKILQNKPKEELYMNWWRYGLYE